MNKFEQLIEFIINDEQDKARELFHEIAVEKSRDIYESLIDEEDLQEVGGNEVEELVDEVTCDESGLSEEEDEEAGEVDVDFDDSGEEDEHEEHHGDVEARVDSLEDALDELKAEFDALMADEAGEPEHADMFGGDEAGDEDEMQMMEAEEDEEEDEEEEMDESIVREYVEKVADQGQKSEGGEVGAGKSASVNAKSTVAGKNDMGGTAANIAKGGAEANPDGTSPKAAVKPKANVPHAGSFENVPGAKAGNAFSKKEGAVKKEEGSVNKTSPLAK